MKTTLPKNQYDLTKNHDNPTQNEIDITRMKSTGTTTNIFPASDEDLSSKWDR
jgi:hypothetical protein